MRLAIISDIHSNIDALKAVLEDCRQREIEAIYSTGDLVGYLPFPNEVLEVIRMAGITAIQGNHDKAIFEASLPEQNVLATMSQKELQASASRIYTLSTLSDLHKTFLGDLPEDLFLEVDGLVIRLVHGSPDKIDEYLYEDSPRLTEIAGAMSEDILVFGHTHLPFHQVVGGKHFINAGSVGKPKQGNPNSVYIIIETREGQAEVEIIEVPYDRGPINEAIKASPLIADALIDHLAQGR